MKRSKHSLSNYKLLSCNMGQLVPIGLTEVLPGDTIQQATSALIRVSPLLAPVMHPVHARIHHWFVPHRLTWDDWENFITGGPDGMNNSQVPFITSPVSTGFGVGSLADYLGGVPPGVASFPHCAMPYRAYALIWNEWYRDQDLQTPLTVAKTSGSDTTTNTLLQNVCWEKDYFTSARVFAQKGPDVTIPIAGRIPVRGIGTNGAASYGSIPDFRETDGTGSGRTATVASTSGSTFSIEQDPTNAGFPGVFADGDAVPGPNINELRLAFALQRYEEARSRYGSRYTEYLRYLGVRSSDARLQRPEYLGGGKQTIQFSEVLQTAPVYDSAEEEMVGEVGALKGHGIGALRSNRYRRFFEEHGYVMSFISVKPRTMYVQGSPRMWGRVTKEDFFQKELQHIGQQEIKNKELYAAHASPNGRFGWQDRYDEYRRQESTVAGQFRTSQLDYWHMARIFNAEPELNGPFVSSSPTDRIFAVPSEDTLWIMANHSIQARRLVSKTGTSSVF